MTPEGSRREGHGKARGTLANVMADQAVAENARAECSLLVRSHAATLNPKDVIVRSGRIRIHRIIAGARFPKRAGFGWSREALCLGVTDGLRLVEGQLTAA